MRKLQLTAVIAAILVGWAGVASADPDKDESGHGRWRGGYERSYRSYGAPGIGYDQDYRRPRGRSYGYYGDEEYRRPRGRAYGYYGQERRERRASKQEYWDGNCKVERKWEGNGEYKEERKCRGGRRGYPSYGYGY